MPVLTGNMVRDWYGSCSIASIYYDTAGYDLIRTSLEKPVYKEKLRLRCYGTANADTLVFIELKKKFKRKSYKRRIRLPYAQVHDFPNSGWEQDSRGAGPGERNFKQIAGEIKHFLYLYRVVPKVYLRYDRFALESLNDPGLRITFDTNIRFRQNDLCLDGDERGVLVSNPEHVLMEVKTPFAIPFWLCRLLSEHHIFPISFSKYGTCYTKYIMRGKAV
jgi:SPX domain protein involved in polyphosphate accumulation